jgi:hypothetical protein
VNQKGYCVLCEGRLFMHGEDDPGCLCPGVFRPKRLRHLFMTLFRGLRRGSWTEIKTSQNTDMNETKQIIEWKEKLRNNEMQACRGGGFTCHHHSVTPHYHPYSPPVPYSHWNKRKSASAIYFQRNNQEITWEVMRQYSHWTLHHYFWKEHMSASKLILYRGKVSFTCWFDYVPDYCQWIKLDIASQELCIKKANTLTVFQRPWIGLLAHSPCCKHSAVRIFLKCYTPFLSPHRCRYTQRYMSSLNPNPT